MQPSKLSTTHTCPVCSTLVQITLFQQHLLQCLDRSPNTSSLQIPSPPSSSSDDDNNDHHQKQDHSIHTQLVTSSTSQQHISKWLNSISFSKYTNAFLNAGFQTVDDLLSSSLSSTAILQRCQINLLGPKRRIQAQLELLLNHKRPNPSTTQSPSSPRPQKKPRTWAIFQPGYHAPLHDTQTTVTRHNRRTTTRQKEKTVPKSRPPRRHHFSHRVPGTSFTVDSFRAASSDPTCTRFFLTHYHSDHYGGLNRSILSSDLRVLCSSVTASLVTSQLRIPSDFIIEIPLASRFDLPDPSSTPFSNNGASIWAYDANHCPGAVILLFYIWKTKRWVLHSGDCRFDMKIFSTYPQLVNVIQKNRLDFLHLDTTYCDPKYIFPSQPDILSQVVTAAWNEDERTKHRCLFFFGTYSIGKEKVFLEVANALNLKIYTTERKQKILRKLDLGPRLTERLVDSPKHARVHVVSMRALSADGLREYANRNGLNSSFIGRGLAIVFRPTGWAFKGNSREPKRINRQEDQAMVYDVAYSEHSSFDELQAFVSWANPARLIPTVNAWTEEQATQLRSLLGHENKPLRSIKSDDSKT